MHHYSFPSSFTTEHSPNSWTSLHQHHLWCSEPRTMWWVRGGGPHCPKKSLLVLAPHHSWSRPPRGGAALSSFISGPSGYSIFKTEKISSGKAVPSVFTGEIKVHFCGRSPWEQPRAQCSGTRRARRMRQCQPPPRSWAPSRREAASWRARYSQTTAPLYPCKPAPKCGCLRPPPVCPQPQSSSRSSVEICAHHAPCA